LVPIAVGQILEFCRLEGPREFSVIQPKPFDGAVDFFLHARPSRLFPIVAGRMVGHGFGDLVPGAFHFFQ
jgi:hypothetical protein